MPADIKSQFENLSGQVSKGAEGVSKSITGMVSSAVKADKAQGNLSKTQASALQISDKFSKAVSSLSKGLTGIGSASIQASKGLASIGRVGESSLAGVVKGWGDAEDRIKDFAKKLKDVEDLYKKMGKSKPLPVPKPPPPLPKPKLKPKAAPKLSIPKTVKEEVKAYKTLSEEYKKAEKLSDLFNSKLIEGRKEAEDFANGLGLTQNKLIAAGVASFFLFKEAAKLVDKFQEARISLAKYNIELAKMGKTTPGVDTSQLEKYRQELNLTREQAKEFYNVLRDGVQSGVVSVSELVKASAQLQQVYGGDQTGRLKEYVDLLNEIPTLDTDLSITASLDDQASSLFALAKKGKISTVIELQQAGLAGGIDMAVTSPEDVEMLNTAQKTEKRIDDINAFLTTKLFPAVGPQLSMVADYTFKTFSAIGAGFAIAGTLQAMMVKRQGDNVNATKAVERAIRSTSGKGGTGGPTGGTRGILQTFKNSFKMSQLSMKRGGLTGGIAGGGFAGIKQSLKRAGITTFRKEILPTIKNVKLFSGALLQAGKGVVSKFSTGLLVAAKTFAGAANIVGVVLMAAGKAADILAAKLEKSGDNIGAAGTKLTGEVLTAAGTVATFAGMGALLGSWIPGIGTAVGGVVGALAGVATVVWNKSGVLGDAMENFGKSLQAPTFVGGEEVDKYGPGMKMFGKWLEEAGPKVKNFGDIAVSTIKGTSKDIWTATKMVGKGAWDLTTKLDLAKLGFKAFNQSLQTKKYKQATKANAEDIKKSSEAWAAAMEKSKVIVAKVAQEQQKMMKSALSLERQMKATAAVANTAKMAFADFQKEVGGLAMEIYREVGGSGERFREAADESAKGISSRFDEMQDGLRQRRLEILKDGTLDATARRQALMDLHNEEMKAVQTFVKGMSELITGMIETPDVMKQGMEMKIREGQLDFSKDMGGFLTGPEVFDRLGKNMESGAKLIEESFEGLAKANELTQVRREAMEKRNEGISKDAIEAFNNLPPALKKDLSGAVKMKTTRETGPGGAVKEVTKVTDVNVDEARKVVKNMKVDLAKVQMEIDASSKIIAEGNWGELVGDMNKVTEAMKGMDVEQKAVDKLTKEAVKDASKRDAADKAQKDLAEKRKNLAQNQASMQEKLNSVMEKRVGGDATAGALLAKMVQAGTTQVGMTKEEAGSYKKAEAAFNDLDKSQDKVDLAIKKRVRDLYRMDELQKASAVADMMVGDEITLANAELQDLLKNQNQLQDNVKAFAQNIDRLANAAADITAGERRLLENRKAETVMAIQSGDALGNLSDIAASNVDIYAKSRQANEKALAEIEKNEAFARKGLAAAKTDIIKDMFRGLIAKAEEARKNIKEGMADLQETLIDTIEGFDETLYQAMKTPAGRKAGFDLDLSGVGMEMAEFSEAAMASLGDMTKLAEDAAKRRADIEKQSLDTWVANAIKAAKALADETAKQLMKPVAEGGKGMTAEQAKASAEATYNAQMATVESEKQLRNAERETNQKRDSLDAVERATRLQMDQLDVASEMVQVQLDLFEGFGGTAEELGGILAKDLDVENRRLKTIKNQAIESRRMTGDSLKTQQLELEVVKKEAEIRKKEFDNVKRVLDLRQREIGIQDELVQAQLDMAMDFGSSLSVVAGLQQQQVALAQQTFEIKQAEYEAAVKAGKTGVDLLEAQKDMEIARMNVQRKSMGVQRDIMEKMLGAALNQTRTSVGARRQRMTDVGLLGYERSRMKTRSGLLTSAGPGGPQPYWKRLAALKGAGGAKRMKPEELLARASEKTADHTLTTAQNTGALAKSALTAGSLYTHDTTAEGLLASILYVAQDIAVGINDMTSMSKGGKDSEYKDKLAKGIAGVQAEVAQRTQEAASQASQMVSTQNETQDVAEKAEAIGKEVAKDSKQTAEAAEPTKNAAKEGTKTEKKILFFDKKNTKAFKSMMADERGARKMLESFVKNGMEIGGVATPLGEMELPKDVTDNIAMMQKNLKETGYMSPGELEMTSKSLAKWGKDVMKESEIAAQETKNIAKTASKSAKGGVGGFARGKGVIPFGPRSGIIPLGSKAGLKGMGGGSLASAKAAKTDKMENIAMVGFDTATKDMAIAATKAKETVLSTTDVADIAAKRSFGPTIGPIGGGSGMMQAKPFVAAGGTAGMGTETSKAAFEGKITVHFDNAMFRNEVTTIALKALNTPEGKNTTQRNAFA